MGQVFTFAHGGVAQYGATQNATPVYHAETPRLFISPLPYIGMHPVIPRKFTGFKQNHTILLEIYRFKQITDLIKIP